MTTQTRTYAPETRTNSPSATVNILGLSKDMWLAALLAISVAANVFLGWAYKSTETETRMLEYYLLELDAKFINAGLKDPAEAISKKLQQWRENHK